MTESGRLPLYFCTGLISRKTLWQGNKSPTVVSCPLAFIAFVCLFLLSFYSLSRYVASRVDTQAPVDSLRGLSFKNFGSRDFPAVASKKLLTKSSLQLQCGHSAPKSKAQTINRTIMELQLGALSWISLFQEMSHPFSYGKIPR